MSSHPSLYSSYWLLVSLPFLPDLPLIPLAGVPPFSIRHHIYPCFPQSLYPPNRLCLSLSLYQRLIFGVHKLCKKKSHSNRIYIASNRVLLTRGKAKYPQWMSDGILIFGRQLLTLLHLHHLLVLLCLFFLLLLLVVLLLVLFILSFISCYHFFIILLSLP